jgi:DNA invertase Pin-like site-specific DNA recombinase
MKAILSRIGLEDLPDNGLREMARIVGVNVIKELIVKCPGLRVRIPKTFHKIYTRKYIEKHFDGGNYNELATDLGVSRRTVFRHLNKPAIH